MTAYDDPRRLLDRKDIDAVIIATPLHLHAKYFLDSLAAGKDVYCEKTMTWDIPEAVACRKAAQKSKQVVQIGLQHESSGELADARKWYEQGMLGKVTMVESWMSRNTPHGHGQWYRAIPADCNPAHVNWDLFLVNRPKTAFDANQFINWRLFWEFSGGNVTENMVHQIAWIMTALNLPLPDAADMMGGVYSEKDGRQVPDTIAVTFEFPNDLTVLWQSTFSNNRYGLGRAHSWVPTAPSSTSAARPTWSRESTPAASTTTRKRAIVPNGAADGRFISPGRTTWPTGWSAFERATRRQTHR